MNLSIPPRLSLLCAGSFGAVLIGMPTAGAVDRAWIVNPPATGDFTDGANWDPTFVTWDAADRAVISNSGTAVLSSGSVTLLEIWVGQGTGALMGTTVGTFEQTGGELTLTDGMVVGRQGGNGTYTLSGGSLAVNNFRVGGGTAASEGTVTISGASTIFTTGSGAGGFAGIGTPGAGSLTLSNSAIWMHQNGVAVVVGGDNNNATQTGGTGSLEVLSGAQFNITSTANLAVGRNAGTGSVLVDGGSIVLSGGGHLNLGAVNGTTIGGGNGTLTITSGAINAAAINVHAGTGAFHFNGGTVTTGALTEGAGSGAVHFNGSTFVASASNANFFNGFETEDLDIQSGGLHFDTNGNDVTFTQGLSGAGGLRKMGDGTLTLAGAGTYAGGTLVEGGILVIAADALPGTGTIVVANGGLLDIDDDLVMTTGGLVLENGSQMILDQSLTFALLMIDGFDFAEGTYDYATLKASYGSIFLDGGSGQITVVPEPSSLVLLGLGGMIAGGILGGRRKTVRN